MEQKGNGIRKLDHPSNFLGDSALTISKMQEEKSCIKIQVYTFSGRCLVVR